MRKAASRCIRRRASFALLALVAFAATVGAPSADSASKKVVSSTAAITVMQATGESLSISWRRVRSAAGYDTYLDGARVAKTQGTAYTFANLRCGGTYTLGVDAFTIKGRSSSIASLVARTSACPVAAVGGNDTSPPTSPTSLTQSGSTATTISLLWGASLDNLGVAGYDLFLNGNKVGTTTATSYSFANLSCGTSYTLALDAYDAAGNRSQRSSLSGTTSGCANVTTSGSTRREVYPGQSILAAIDSSAAGDTVFVHAGNYPKLTLNSKTFTGGKVHIVGEPGTVIAGVLLQSVGGYSFEHLTSSLPSTTNCCESGFYVSGTSHDIDIVDATIRGGWDGVKVYAAYPSVASNIVVRDSDIAGAGEDDFHIDGAQNMLVEHNFIHDPVDNSIHNDGIQSQRSDGLTITRNTISFQSVAPYDGPNQGIILNEDCTLPNGLVTNSVISNNLIAHWNAGRPVELSGVNGVKVVNNTLVDDGPSQNYASITLNKRSGCNFDALNVEIWNNIADMVYVDAGSSFPTFCDTNLIRHPWSGLSCANTITADPQFLDTTSYALKSTSPARGIGLTRPGTPTIAIDGALLTTPPDLGATG
jgi:Right handed beta helix region